MQQEAWALFSAGIARLAAGRVLCLWRLWWVGADARRRRREEEVNACYSTPRLTTAGWGLSYWGQRWAGRDRAWSAGEEEAFKLEAGQLRPLSCIPFPGNSPVWAGLSLFSSQTGLSERVLYLPEQRP